MSITAQDRIVTDWASQSGHWYRPSGEPAYSIIGANGKERATTLRDARKLGLYPSVTTILKASAKPGLERWKAEQLLMSALTLQQMPEESEQSWIGRVWQDSMQQAVQAADKGTRIHAAIELSYRGKAWQKEFDPWVALVQENVNSAFGDEPWKAERCFSHPSGYGGKVDLHSERALIDIKTKDGDLADQKIYDEHKMQVGAYAQGLSLSNPICAVLFVSREEPIVKLAMLEDEEVAHGLAMFNALLAYWQIANKLPPKEVLCSESRSRSLP